VMLRRGPMGLGGGIVMLGRFIMFILRHGKKFSFRYIAEGLLHPVM
jgi:hypothetical protein